MSLELYYSDLNEKAQRVLVDSQQQLRFRLIGGLELAEPIRGKLR